MLRNTIIMLAAGLMVVSTGCNKEELENLRQQNEKLNQQIEQKNQTIDDLKQTNSQIEQSLQLIIDKQGDVDQADLDKVPGEQMKQRLSRLKEMVQTSGKEAEELKADLRGARSQAVKYKKQVYDLEEKISHYEDSIRAINKDLTGKVQKIKEMSDELYKKDTALTRIRKENKKYLESLHKKNRVMNTGYVAVGAEKDLQENDVIVKKGGFLGFLGQTASLNPDFNQEDFETFDIPDEQKITIEAAKRKVEVVTPQPKNAYKLEEADGTTTLTITDSEQFWRATKYLVISY